MKTTLVSFFIFAILIGSGIYFHYRTENTCSFLHENLKKANEEIAENNWSEASKTFQLMQKIWNEEKQHLALFTHHDLLDNVQIALARVSAAAEGRSIDALRIESASLKKELDDLHHADHLELENIF